MKRHVVMLVALVSLVGCGAPDSDVYPRFITKRIDADKGYVNEEVEQYIEDQFAPVCKHVEVHYAPRAEFRAGNTPCPYKADACTRISWVSSTVGIWMSVEDKGMLAVQYAHELNHLKLYCVTGDADRDHVSPTWCLGANKTPDCELDKISWDAYHVGEEQ